MNKIFKSNQPNFPATEYELNMRLSEVMKQPRSINQDFYFMRNPDEEALREISLGVYGDDGKQRFYFSEDRFVALDDRQRFIISNDWYADHSSCPNKGAFFNWLKEQAKAAYRKYEANNGHKPVMVIAPTNSRRFTKPKAI